MTRIAPLTIDQADATTAAVLKGVQAKFGMLPNLVATLARAPAALNGYLQLAQALGGGGLSARQRAETYELGKRMADAIRAGTLEPVTMKNMVPAALRWVLGMYARISPPHRLAAQEAK